MFRLIIGGREFGRKIRGNGERSLRQAMRWHTASSLTRRPGFISVEWLPYFINSRRCGYDFDSRWEDGKASYREKKIMDFFLSDNEDEPFKDIYILSTDLKKQAAFGNGGEKNYPGIITQLQMETYLVISDFRRWTNKKGEEYGMAVSVMLPPEKLWGYDRMTAAYSKVAV